jgi:hypothetical protein
LARTRLEQNIRHKRQRSGILVPLLEDRLKWPVRIENEKDVNFIREMLHKNIEREDRREGEEKVYSPSALSECLRKVYLTKNFKKLDIPKVFSPNMSTNFYFEMGEWTHLRLTYRLWKLAQEFPEVEILDFERPVISKRKDHGGTIDVVVAVNDEPLIVDWKGVHVGDFGKFTRGSPPIHYTVQVVDYLWLARLDKNFPWKVERALLIAENKGGPNPQFPVALHETVLEIEDHLPELKVRMGQLRGYETKKEIPPPECVSTRSIQFQSCPFQKYCKEEVKEIQRANNLDANGYQVAVPKRRRTDRS